MVPKIESGVVVLAGSGRRMAVHAMIACTANHHQPRKPDAWRAIQMDPFPPTREQPLRREGRGVLEHVGDAAREVVWSSMGWMGPWRKCHGGAASGSRNSSFFRPYIYGLNGDPVKVTHRRRRKERHRVNGVMVRRKGNRIRA